MATLPSPEPRAHVSLRVINRTGRTGSGAQKRAVQEAIFGAGLGAHALVVHKINGQERADIPSRALHRAPVNGRDAIVQLEPALRATEAGGDIGQMCKDVIVCLANPAGKRPGNDGAAQPAKEALQRPAGSWHAGIRMNEKHLIAALPRLLPHLGTSIEFGVVRKDVNLMDLVKRLPTSI